jgi:hypothetical protein
MESPDAGLLMPEPIAPRIATTGPRFVAGGVSLGTYPVLTDVRQRTPEGEITNLQGFPPRPGQDSNLRPAD